MLLERIVIKNPVLLSTREAAKYLSISASSMEQWRRAGKGPVYVRVGKQVRYRVPDLDAFIVPSKEAEQAAA